MSLYISNIYDFLINVYACDCMCIDQYALWTSGCNWFGCHSLSSFCQTRWMLSQPHVAVLLSHLVWFCIICLSWYPSCPQITFVTPWVVQRIVDNRLPSKWPNQMDICEHSWIFFIRNSKHYCMAHMAILGPRTNRSPQAPGEWKCWPQIWWRTENTRISVLTCGFTWCWM